MHSILGNNVRFLRRQRHLTQQQLADKMDCNKSTIYNVESGRTSSYSAGIVVRLMEYFNSTLRSNEEQGQRDAHASRPDAIYAALIASGHCVPTKNKFIDPI